MQTTATTATTAAPGRDNHDSRRAELAKRIADAKKHECSYDEREGGCPVCGDIDAMEHELILLRRGA